MGIKSIILRLPPVLCKSTNSNLGKLIQFSQRKIPLPIFAQGFKNQRSILSLNNLKTIINYAIQNNESFFNNEKTINDILMKSYPWQEQDTNRLDKINVVKFWRLLTGHKKLDVDYWLTRIENTLY